jgi:hypothetical protein
MIPDRYVRNHQQANEPEQIRNLDKPEAYAVVAHAWFIPALSSKCMTRNYLSRVLTNNVFRVPQLVMTQFWAELPLNARSKSPFFSNELAFLKLQALLQALNHQLTGFTASNLPDQAWVEQVLRFLDRKNLSICFLMRCPGEAEIDGNEGTVFHVTAVAQSIAKQRLIMNGNINYLVTNKLVHDKAQAIWESKRKLLALETYMDRLAIQQPTLVTQRTQLRAKVLQLLSEFGMSVYLLREHNPQQIANPLQDAGARGRAFLFSRA